MELFLINTLAFLRPILSIETGVRFLSLNLLEVAAVGFSAMIAAAFAIRAAVHKKIVISAVDLVIGALVIWCVAIYLIFFGEAKVNELAKLIIPPLTYVVAKSVLTDRQDYLKMLWLLILGFSIPVFTSAALILFGGGLDRISYWTGAPRYEGVYNGAHTMSHNAAFLLMIVWLYLLIQRENGVLASELSRSTKSILSLLIAAAIFLLYMGRVRTTLLGLFVFCAILLALHYKRLSLIVVITVSIGLSVLLLEDVQKRFFPERFQAEKTNDFDVMKYGSNRPAIWSRQIAEFRDLPMDRQIAGIGIGNTFAEQTGQTDDILHKDTHNDYLRVMVHTGVVGLLLFLALQWLVLKRILSLNVSIRWGFLALFAAVTVMNLVSASYVSRFGLGQMYYLILACLEVPRLGSLQRATDFQHRLKTAHRWRTG